jgi:hypothetical protein
MKKSIALLALVLTLSLGAFAEHPGGPPAGAGKPTPADLAAKQVKFLTVLLDLTSTQQDKATQLFTAAETAKVAPEADIEKQEALLAAAETATPTGTLTTPIAAIAADTALILAADAGAEAAFYSYLVDPTQKAKYKGFLEGEFEVPDRGKGPGNGQGPSGSSGNGHGNGH